MGFFKRIFCIHYYEDTPSVRFAPKFFSETDFTGFNGLKKMICNKCGKTTYKPMDFIDIKFIDNNK